MSGIPCKAKDSGAKGNVVCQDASAWVPYDETSIVAATGQLTSSWGEGENIDRIDMTKKSVFRCKLDHGLHCYLNELH